MGTAPGAWWISVLFILGSACFLVGPLPFFVGLVGAEADDTLFFNVTTFRALTTAVDQTPYERGFTQAQSGHLPSGAPTVDGGDRH